MDPLLDLMLKTLGPAAIIAALLLAGVRALWPQLMAQQEATTAANRELVQAIRAISTEHVAAMRELQEQIRDDRRELLQQLGSVTLALGQVNVVLANIERRLNG